MGKRKDDSMYGGYSYKSCAESHPVLKVGKFEIKGGSVTRSKHFSTDIVIGFDRGMERTERQYPWTEGEEIFFYIQDMGVPSSVEDFKKLISYTVSQLTVGRSVFAGCIGGHGRTGLFLAALVKVVTGEEDAISYVRKNYCQKAVESKRQVDWLNKHFGIKKVKGAKEPSRFGTERPAYRTQTYREQAAYTEPGGLFEDSYEPDWRKSDPVVAGGVIVPAKTYKSIISD